MKRRAFVAGAAAVPLTVLVTASLSGCSLLPVFPKRPTPDAEAALGWVRHDGGGRYTLWLPRAEMGQHIGATLRALAAMELGVATEAVALRLPSTADIGRVKATVGSESVAVFALPLAQACATLRDALARRESGATLRAEARDPATLRSLARGGLPAALLHDDAAHAVVTGGALHAADVRLPGMLYGRVLRAPASPDLAARPAAWDAAAARAVPGFVALVEPGTRDAELLQQGRSQGLGIVARTPGALDRIAEALAPRWAVDGGFTDADLARAIDIDAARAGGAMPHRVDQAGDGDEPSDAAGPRAVDLRIDVAAAPHAGLEPRCAVAAFDAAGALDLWAGTQDAFFVRDVLARALGLGAEAVRVHPQRIGGGFGARTICTVEREAAALARAAGAPVKLQWTREQELRQGFHRPPSSHRLRVRVDGRGEAARIAAWSHDFVSTPILLTNAALPEWLNPITRFTGDAGVARGAALPYRAAARRTRYALRRLPLYTGPWRGLGAGPNTLAVESAIDEAARAAGADALAFRLRHAADPRLARVLRRAADAAGWGRPLPAGRARGIGCGIYKGTAYAATVAEVGAVDGRWRVLRLVCAVDCGRLLHPDAVRAQTEGNLVWSLGLVLGAPLALADGGVAASGFHDAPIPRLDEVPPIEVLLVDEGDPPGGAGETAMAGAAGAIANAWAAASGRRPLRFPIPEAQRRAGPGATASSAPR